jgi:transglutaminase-like putative cysteine protease
MSVQTVAANAVRYAVRHETRYHYQRAVAHSHQQLHLTPRSGGHQRCLEHDIEISPTPAVCEDYLDAFGNTVTRFELDRPHEELEVIARMTVSLEPRLLPEPQEGESWERVREQLMYRAQPWSAQWLEAMRFRCESPYVRIKRVLGDFMRDCLVEDASVCAVATALMDKVHAEFEYAPGATEVATPLLQMFGQRRGVCQDFAHLMIACLRSCGLAARYVSGYLRAHPGRPAPEPSAGASLQGADASHAWVGVFAPPFGWLEFDPTNNLRVAQEHVTLAYGRDFGDVSPLRGVILGGGSHSLAVRVAVQPLEVQLNGAAPKESLASD